MRTPVQRICFYNNMFLRGLLSSKSIIILRPRTKSTVSNTRPHRALLFLIHIEQHHFSCSLWINIIFLMMLMLNYGYTYTVIVHMIWITINIRFCFWTTNTIMQVERKYSECCIILPRKSILTSTYNIAIGLKLSPILLLVS